MKEFYQMSRTEAQKTINGSTQPLTNEQIKANQEKYGPNALLEEKKKSIPQIFLEQYKDFLVIILIVAAIVSGVLGEMESAIVILVVITMNVSQSPDCAMVTIFSPVLLPPAFGASVWAVPPALAAVPDVPREDPPHAESSMVHAMEAAITLTKLRLIMFLL